MLPQKLRSYKLLIIQASLVLILANHNEAKEFDWSDLGVSLGSSKLPLSNASNNLRILVSPQRRMTKK